MGTIDGVEETPASGADAGVTRPDSGPGPQPDAMTQTPPPSGVAPAGTVPAEIKLANGATAVTIGTTTSVYRVDAAAAEHVEFALTFTGGAAVTLAVDRWTGTQPEQIGLTDSGGGVRFLAALDRDDKRTYWVRLHATSTATGTLTLTRTAFEEGPKCSDDCARLMQMPLPNEPDKDGYDTDSGTIFRYWFGRRDLVMLVRYIAHERAAAGKTPIFPYDFSQWDGQTPGTDVGAPRHASHQRGKDVDVSLYGTDGLAVWRSFCTTEPTDGGRQCVPGTRKDVFDGFEVAREVALAFESGRITMSFLDRELIAAVRPGAQAAVTDGMVDPAYLPLYNDGKHIQHWPNHDNHIHLRVSEDPYDGRIYFEPPFEAP